MTQPSGLKKALKAVLVFSLTAYVGFGVFLYFLQERMVFHFAPVPDDFQYSFSSKHEEVTLKTESSFLHGVVFKTGVAARRGLVLYYKGNAGNVANSESMAQTFLSLGFDVLSMDYRGYGKSKGEVTEAALLQDAEAWYDWGRQTYAGEEIRVIGWSLGSAFASHVAATRPVDHVILFTPFKSVVDMAARQYPLFRFEAFVAFPFRNDEKLEQAELKSLTIYHGTDDTIIAYDSAKSLADHLNGKADFISVSGGTHNSVPWDDDVLADIRARWGA